MRILAAAGASGGHIFPALGFLESLQDSGEDIQTLLILPERSRVEIPAGYPLRRIPVSPVKLNLGLGVIPALFNFFKASLQTFGIIAGFKPELVVGFGSLASVPAVLLAWLFRIKTVIHEQNVIPGRANRFLAYFSDRIAVSFPGTRDYLHRQANKVILSGNPLRKSMARLDKEKALDFFGFKKDKFTVLVMGGSQASHKINLAFPEAVRALKDSSLLQVIHLAGEADLAMLEAKYQPLKIKVKLFGFLKEMQYAYSAADLVISRAGATSIAEIISFKIPAVLIPYPFAYKHQTANAQVLSREGAASLIEDSALDKQGLKDILEEYLDNPEKINFRRLAYDKFPQLKAGAALAESALSLLN